MLSLAVKVVTKTVRDVEVGGMVNDEMTGLMVSGTAALSATFDRSDSLTPSLDFNAK